MIHRLFILITFGFGLIAPAFAQNIFTETFQDGDMKGWRGAAGRGDIRLTEYEGNLSLRLQRDAWAGVTLGVDKADSYAISVDFAADNLEGSDRCLLEYAANGTGWVELGHISDGRDDGLSLYTISGKVPGPAEQLVVRVRVDGNADNDTCWADNLRVTAVLKNSAQAANDVVITAALLRNDAPLRGPFPTSQFAPGETALASETGFRGQLTVQLMSLSVQKRILLDRFGYEDGSDPVLSSLPEIASEFIRSGEHMLPVKRGLVLTENPYWDYILTPGRVWREPGDGEWTRAALPFALVEKNANCVHNGLLTFAFRADGTLTPAVWQIGSETCAYFQFDAWGRADTAYEPGIVASAPDAVARDQKERAARLPVRPISMLGQTYAGTDVSAFGAAEDVSPASVTTFGLVAQGIHYVGGCETRFGPYLFCDEMVIPSYSFAKSLFGGLGLMRLEKLYPGAMKAVISDYVPACADTGSWDDVTFENALDMTTGHYRSTEPEADENAVIDQNFFVLAKHADKIRLACTHYARRTAPGNVFVYHTSDTYLLGTAMQAYLQEQAGLGADIYRDLLVEPLWKPLGLSATMDETRRTSHDDIGQPFTGWGLFMQSGDLARILQFIGPEKGRIDGEDMFAAEQLAAALQRRPYDRGLPASAPPLGYNNGFWSFDVQSYGGCDEPAPIPFLSGFGGLAAAILPNGTAYYYISDGGAYAWARAALATETISPFCKGATP